MNKLTGSLFVVLVTLVVVALALYSSKFVANFASYMPSSSLLINNKTILNVSHGVSYFEMLNIAYLNCSLNSLLITTNASLPQEESNVIIVNTTSTLNTNAMLSKTSNNKYALITNQELPSFITALYYKTTNSKYVILEATSTEGQHVKACS